jgi:uncharacterized protein involved in exopolysaccharide biosynthesis
LSDIERSAVAQAPSSRVTTDVAGSRQAEAARFEAELDLSRYVHVLRRGWKLIAAGALVGGLAGLGSSLLKPAQYEATTTLSVDVPNPQAAATLRALLQGPTLAADTVHELGLDRDPPNITPEALLTHVQIEQVTGTNLVKVKVTLLDPTKAAGVSRLLATKAVALNRQIATAGNRTLTEQLKKAFDASADRLRTAEQQLLEYQNEKQVEVSRTDADAMLAERGDLLRLQLEIEAEKARLASAQEQIQKQQPVLPVPPSVQLDGVPIRTGQMVPADHQGADVARAFINPAYQTLAAEIATSQTRLAGLERQRREALQVRKLGAGRFEELNELYRREMAVARLQTDYDVAKRIYSDLALRYEQSRMVTAGGIVQVVDAAIPPADPLPRRRLESTALGLTAGLLLALLSTLVSASGVRTSQAASA